MRKWTILVVSTLVSAGCAVGPNYQRPVVDLPGDFGPSRIQPGLPGAAILEPGPGRYWYVFAGMDLRATALDLFLDGNT